MSSDRRPRIRSPRAALIVLCLALFGIVAVAAVGFVVMHTEGPPPSLPGEEPPALSDGLPGDSSARRELAMRPMPALPLSAAAPQSLAPASALSAPLRLPRPSGRPDSEQDSLPPTAEGAIAALIALDEAGLRSGDPAAYSETYLESAASGAPPPELTGLVDLLRSMRIRAGFAPTGPVPGLDVQYRVTQAQVKGVLDDSRYAVVCVLGQFDAAYQGTVTSYGVGDCQAMSYSHGRWLISPGAGAAQAADAWPGSQPAQTAGYVQVIR